MSKLSNMLFLFSISIILACVSRESKQKEEVSWNCFTSMDSIFSIPIKTEIQRILSKDKEPPFDNRVYSVYIKTYFNLTSVFVCRELFLDTTDAKRADYISLADHNLLIIHLGLNNLLGGKQKDVCFEYLKNRGYNTDWNGKTKLYVGYMLYAYNGTLIKTDSLAPTGSNIISPENQKVEFMK